MLLLGLSSVSWCVTSFTSLESKVKWAWRGSPLALHVAKAFLQHSQVPCFLMPLIYNLLGDLSWHKVGHTAPRPPHAAPVQPLFSATTAPYHARGQDSMKGHKDRGAGPHLE